VHDTLLGLQLATGIASSVVFLRLSFLLNTAYRISLGILDRVSMPSGLCWTWLMAVTLVTIVTHSYNWSPCSKQFLRLATALGQTLHCSLHFFTPSAPEELIPLSLFLIFHYIRHCGYLLMDRTVCGPWRMSHGMERDDGKQCFNGAR
jgi:hypothetical protein